MLLEQTNTKVITTVDPETGEVVDQHVNEELNIRAIRKVKDYPEFIMIYLKDIAGFLQIDNATQIQILSIIWKESTFNNPETNQGNTIAILKDDKERWAEQLNVGVRTIDNAISALVEKDLLLREGRGKYKLNPKYYFKGTNADRTKILKLQVDYNFDDNDLSDVR